LRLVGYRRAIEAAGLPFRQELVIEVWDWHRSDGAEAMRGVLASEVAFDGVVAFNDSIALGAMRVLQQAGIRVPQDVAMIGFDDIDEASYSLPTLSTIDPGREEIADTAVRVLLERITGSRAPAAPRQYVTAFRVIQRESSAVTKTQQDLMGPLAHTS
jgi:DNA-binding LacI/PurR family transcriptional regulator